MKREKKSPEAAARVHEEVLRLLEKFSNYQMSKEQLHRQKPKVPSAAVMRVNT